MSFHDILFSIDVSFGATGGAERRTDIITLGSGFEHRSTPWVQSRRRYNAGSGVKSIFELHEILTFFEARCGRLHGFRWRDWLDYQTKPPYEEPSPSDETLYAADESRLIYPLTKTYRSGEYEMRRRITKPVRDSVSVAKDRVTVPPSEYSVNHDRGIITFNTPIAEGETITAGFIFDVPVRFDTDYLEINLNAYLAGEIPDIPLIEIRTEEEEGENESA